MIRRGVARPIAPADKHDNIAQQVAPTLARPFRLIYSSMKETKQGTSFSVFVFLWLRSMWRDRTLRREPEGTTRLDEGARVRRAGRALQLGRQGRCSATVLLSTLCRFSNFMKKEGRSRIAGGGIAGGHCSPDTWRPTSWGGAMRAGGAGWREEEWK